LIGRDGRLAVGDGAGFPVEAWPGVLELLRRRRDVRLLLGLCLSAPNRADALAADRASTLVGGFGARPAIDAGQIAFLPVRLGTVPALLASALRADVLLAAVRPMAGGYAFTTEVSWLRAALDAGATLAAVVREKAPACDDAAAIDSKGIVVLGAGDAAPGQLAPPLLTDAHREIGHRVAALLPDGARIQVGPGAVGAAVLEAVRRPVAVDTGLITDAVCDLGRRGLLDGPPLAPYVIGTDLVYDWSPGRVRLAGVEVTHDPGRLARGRPLVAVNTALEIDLDGQVNAEAHGGSAIGGIGGQPDYAAAAAASAHGLSIIALAARTSAGRPTLVRQLRAPVTTPSHDVGVVVTENGVADLRGRTRRERRAVLLALWGAHDVG
jgi:acyl-CoA hydrolase